MYYNFSMKYREQSK